MTMAATAAPYRRGACPGLSAPMPTGDGLLVRILPTGTISLIAFAALCEAARTHGNGVIEVTSRGSIQIRGLTEVSAAQFADAVGALGIAADDGVPVLCNPLAGFDVTETFDCAPLAAQLRHAIAQRGLTAELSPKVSIVIDGGGAAGLAEIAADIRLRAQQIDGEALFHVGIGGDETHATDLGHVAAKHGVAAALCLLSVIARHGREARGRDVVAVAGATVFRSAIGAFTSTPPRESGDPKLDSRLPGDERNTGTGAAIGTFPLRNGKIARGIGLAFGHTDAGALERLIAAAQEAGATGLRAAPGRALLAIGVTSENALAFSAAAARLGFIIAADDPRRNVIACAGAPICASAHIASRALAPAIAATGATRLGTIHISGCAKGCARSSAAALTVIGTAESCVLVANGSVRDTPFASVPATELVSTIDRYAHENILEAAHV